MAICVPPASPHVAITVRRFGTRSFSAAQLGAQGALPAHIRDEAERVLHTRRNILVSGGTASGNTTLLNVLIALIPDDQRIVAIEDTLESSASTQPAELVRRDATALVGDRDRHIQPLALRRDPDGGGLGRVTRGVGEQVVEHLHQALPVGHDSGQVGRQVDADGVPPAAADERAARLVHQHGDIRRLGGATDSVPVSMRPASSR